MALVALDPVRQRPAALAHDGQRENVSSVLDLRVTHDLRPATAPIVFERLVVLFIHEPIDTNEVKVAVGARW